MKMKLLLGLYLLAVSYQLSAQRQCSSFSYEQSAVLRDPSLSARWNEIETFARNYIVSNTNATSRTMQGVIKIPVVVHILYHQPGENLTDANVQAQLDILNRCFRRTNSDTIHTPARFAGLAADCEIEFQLATSDPGKRITSGIVRKYTPISEWKDDDKMKFSASMGDDAWDPSSYLNIWVCNMELVAGYSSKPGGPVATDGVVIDYPVFGGNGHSGFDMGKTTVHEVGHWLSLRHLWGDDYCGEDGVSDTPRQAGYNSGCPTAISVTCGNGPDGDMYMNYMDFTADACMNMFTEGQKLRMRALFATGGARNSLLYSTGLLPGLIAESPVPDQTPRWLHPQLFPNPATDAVTLDIAHDSRWVGKTISIFNLQGQVVMQVPITTTIQVIPVSKLRPGMYILSAKKEDGAFIQQKFIKL